jgi:translocation and assembly module TamB
VKFRLDANMTDLAVLRPFVLAVDSLGGTAALTVEGVGSIGAPSATGTLSIEDMSAQFASGTVARGGIASAFELVVANDSSVTGSFTLRPAGLRLSQVQADSTSGVWFRNSALEVTAGADGVRASLNAILASDRDSVVATLRGQGAIPGYSRVGRPIWQEPVEVTLEGRVDDFAFLPAFVPALDSASGAMRLNARLAGTVGEAHLGGEAVMSDVALRIPGLGILLDDLNLTAKGDQGEKIEVKAAMKSGGGELTIDGETPARPTKDNPGHMSVRGKDFLAANNAQVRASITPAIDVTLAGDKLDINGQVDIPSARIELDELPEMAIRPSDDVVVIQNGGESKPSRPMFAHLRVVLGDDVSFKGFNFDARLGGTLNMVDVPGWPARATGTLVIKEGRYQSYGQDLTVTNGEVRFNGRVDNPGLNIRAIRVVHDTMTVGIAMMGSLKEPDVRLFSQPPMAQTQILSYIVTGGPVGGSGASGNLINKALSALGLGGGSQLVNALGHDVGLSSAKIETEADLQDAALVVGKFLSPRLYISYGIGLFDPVSTLRLRYILSNQFSLQVETGKATSADAVVRVRPK